MDWIQLAEDYNGRQALLNTVINIQVLIKGNTFITSQTTIRFSEGNSLQCPVGNRM